LIVTFTRREEKIIDAYSATPEALWEPVGKAAYGRWSAWLRETKGKLAWDPEQKVFVTE